MLKNFIQNMYLKIENLDKKKEMCLIFFMSLLLVFSITIGMGTITSGWHLVDDHEFLRWFYEMRFEGKSVANLINEWVSRDLYWRYEPLYYSNRILSCALFGINLVPYSILKSIEIAFSCFFLYYCGRLMGANKVYSFLFASMSLIGYQSAVWWKLGPQEAQCTLLFSIGFYCMLKWLNNKHFLWAIGSIIAFFVMCNYKESYIILLPFLMLYVLYFDLSKYGEKVTWKNILKNIKNKLWYYLVLGAIFTILILFIVFYVGVNDYDKVGLDASLPWETYIEAYKKVFSGDLKWYKRFGTIFVLILLTYWEQLKEMWKEILLIVSFLLPQFIIFGQTGIAERYILPSSIAFSLFFIIMIPKQNILSGKRKLLYQLCIILLLMAHGRVALREADYFRYRGESVTTMLEAVLEMSQGQEKVLSCLRPNEEGNLTMNFYMADHGCDNVYYWTEDDGTINQVWGVNSEFTPDRYVFQNFDDMNIVVMYNQEDRHWCYTPSLDLTDFTKLKCGTLDIYVRNGNGITLADTAVEGLRINF